MSKGDDILDRLLTHAVAITKLCNDLPKNRATTHITGQLLRSGTAPAPNYAEARAGESRQDFIHKLGIVLKELNETLVWLEMLRRMNAAPSESVKTLVDECDQLCRIFAASIKTASSEKLCPPRPLALSRKWSDIECLRCFAIFSVFVNGVLISGLQ